MVVRLSECHLKLEERCGRYILLLPEPVHFVVVYISIYTYKLSHSSETGDLCLNGQPSCGCVCSGLGAHSTGNCGTQV